MKEELLHAAWQFGLFEKSNLYTDTGEIVEILRVGSYNTGSGPDFFNARIRLGNILLAGNVEIHVRAEEWYAHGHENDKAYENVILHVVLNGDKPVRCGKRKIPTVKLDGRIWSSVTENYEQLMDSLGKVPCENSLQNVSDSFVRLWISRVAAERLEEKTQQAKRLVSDFKYSSEQAFFILLAGNFGFHVNRIPFEEMATGIDVRLFSKHKNSRFQIEAMLFGRAGLLEREMPDAYAQELQKEFSFLRLKYAIVPMNAAAWKFGGTRPANFPTVRLAQLAALIFRSSFMMSAILESESAVALRRLFMAEVSPYWKTHYDFGKSSAKNQNGLSSASVDLLLINTVAPFLFYSGIKTANDELKERAVSLLESIKPERNKITEIWANAGFPARCAADSQGMLHLFRNYCSNKRCLHCGIGNKILGS